MSFGFSPTDLVKLGEITARVYIAFKDANENSEVQVESLVREFKAFAECLLELAGLMEEFGKPLPFPVDAFKETLHRCEASLKPYQENLVDKKMGLTKIVWTIKYIGKEKELDFLRKQITGHYQALHMCVSFMQLRLNMESTRREQRLLLEPRHRAMSLGGQWYTTGAVSASTPNSPLALPAPENAHPLYKDWEIFDRWLKAEEERDEVHARPSSWGDTPAPDRGNNVGMAAARRLLRCGVADAIFLAENRSKREAVEQYSHLAPSDAMRRQVQEMPPMPQRAYTMDSDLSSSYNPFENRPIMNDSIATIQQRPNRESPGVSPMASPQIEQQFFASGHWASSPNPSEISYDTGRFSVSTTGSRTSISSDPRHLASPMASPGLRISTTGTTPENAVPGSLRSVESYTPLLPMTLPESPLQWIDLCRKVKVECKATERVRGREKTACQAQECDLHWKYREDRSMLVRASYRSLSDGRAKGWSTQEFPAAGPSIPLTTTINGKVSIHFPRGSFGKLDKQWADINYTFSNTESSKAFQTLLYTNNGRDAAELLFDKPINTISSDKNKPECTGRNLRLWRRTEMHLRPDGPVRADVLVVLFYTNTLEAKGHWVEEPHYAFEWLTEPTYARSSDKLTLTYSKDPARWTLDKLFQNRRSSRGSESSATSLRRDSTQPPGITRSGTAESSASIRSSRTFFAGRSSASSRMGNLNYFGYAKLDIEFLSSQDRREFLDIWKKGVKSFTDSG